MAAVEFGPFRYDLEQRLLFRGGELVPLVPKAIDTLHALIERRGRIVEKAELMKLVWPDTTVEEVGLARNISILRKALGEEADSAEYIETVPRRGYRFVATVPQRRRLWIPAVGAAVAVALAAAVVYWQFYTPSHFLPPGSAAIAVVPFDCLMASPECAAFAAGTEESLVASLARLPGIHVVAPSTVRRHRAMRVSMGLMGRLLGLDALVEATVQRFGADFRVTSRLVDVHTARLIWSETPDHKAADSSQMQSDAASAIAADVGAHLAIHSSFPPAKH